LRCVSGIALSVLGGGVVAAGSLTAKGTSGCRTKGTKKFTNEGGEEKMYSRKKCAHCDGTGTTIYGCCYYAFYGKHPGFCGSMSNVRCCACKGTGSEPRATNYL